MTLSSVFGIGESGHGSSAGGTELAPARHGAEQMAIRWTDIPHAEIAAAIHIRVGGNAVRRAAEDASRHILSRRLACLIHES